jgi:hypothetical protein
MGFPHSRPLFFSIEDVGNAMRYWCFIGEDIINDETKHTFRVCALHAVGVWLISIAPTHLEIIDHS